MRKFFIFFIRIYQKAISPYKGFKCPFYPSCSRYAIDAFEKHGAFKGLLLGTWRVLRCNPFNRFKNGTVDPVPEEFLVLRKPDRKLISVKAFK